MMFIAYATFLAGRIGLPPLGESSQAQMCYNGDTAQM
jgi:hypothetical protein